MFWTIAWCASQIFISSAGVNSTQCFDTQYQVYDSTTSMVQFYSTLNMNQKASAKMYEMTEVKVIETTELQGSALSPLPTINEQN